jgi:hypothetical protein
LIEKIRLAERRGIFTRKHISPVAETCLLILMHMEETDKLEARLREMKMALINSGQGIVDLVEPDSINVRADSLIDDEGVISTVGLNLDLSGVEAPPQAEIEALFDQLRDEGGATFDLPPEDFTEQSWS